MMQPLELLHEHHRDGIHLGVALGEAIPPATITWAALLDATTPLTLCLTTLYSPMLLAFA